MGVFIICLSWKSLAEYLSGFVALVILGLIYYPFQVRNSKEASNKATLLTHLKSLGQKHNLWQNGMTEVENIWPLCG